MDSCVRIQFFSCDGFDSLESCTVTEQVEDGRGQKKQNNFARGFHERVAQERLLHNERRLIETQAPALCGEPRVPSCSQRSVTFRSNAPTRPYTEPRQIFRPLHLSWTQGHEYVMIRNRNEHRSLASLPWHLVDCGTDSWASRDAFDGHSDTLAGHASGGRNGVEENRGSVSKL